MIPENMPPAMRAWANNVSRLTRGWTNFDGDLFSQSSAFPGLVPATREWLWAIIEDRDFYGSGTFGSGTGSGSGIDSQHDEAMEGYAYAWREVRPKHAAEADQFPGGMIGTLRFNTAYEWNKNIDVQVGTIVQLWRGWNDEWVFIAPNEAAGSGSGSHESWRITCNSDGSATATRI